MRHGSLFCALVLLGLSGCPGGNAALGDRCNSNGDCNASLQCVANVCVPRCQRAPECGDGYSCDANGYCHLATGEPGDACTSEVDCAPGLACKLDATLENGQLVASCDQENAGRPAGAACGSDGECRDGTCALGHCVDLCSDTRDCGAGTSCTAMPRVQAQGTSPIPKFNACLQSHGSLRWSIPVSGPLDDNVLLPVPDTARSVAVTFAIDDPKQLVGALRVVSPSGLELVNSLAILANPDLYYTSPVRHQLQLGQSVLAMPSSPATPLEPGTYTMSVGSWRVPNGAGTATPVATAVVKLDTSVLLDLHFYFLNNDDHPCSAAFGGGSLNAQTAQSAAFFQDDFLSSGLRSIFAAGGVALGTITYEDLRNHPDLDALDASSAGALLSLGAHDTGVNVFFVRSLSPIGLQAIGANPGPAGIAGTPQSGIIVALDTLCYRSWNTLARITAHELARYMGLYDNVEADEMHTDPLVDTDTSIQNLMHYSELGDTQLSDDQRNILTRSPVLR